MSYNQILNLVGSDGRKLQFYPGIKVRIIVISRLFFTSITIYRLNLNNDLYFMIITDQIIENRFTRKENEGGIIN